MKRSHQTKIIQSNNAEFVEQLYADYLKKPNLVSAEWRAYFQQLQNQENQTSPEFDHKQIQLDIIRHGRDSRKTSLNKKFSSSVKVEYKQVNVLQLINAYRFRGHQHADFNPLNSGAKENVPELELAYHNLSDDDLDTVFNTGSLFGPRQATLREIFSVLRNVYSSSIGVEYMHITDTEEKRWIQHRLEGSSHGQNFSVEEKLQILKRVVAASEFEKYLHTKYVGQKRFSLEGGESLIPMLDEVIARSGASGVEEIVIGMAHRGRLNVLTNMLGKAPSELFKEFEGRSKHNGDGSGDVKYHQGFSSDIKTAGGVVHLALAFNPSHLEIISPVVQGSVRARQDKRKDTVGARVLSIAIHGDAAFSGQGVVMETLQMSEARGYTTGGTIHIIINNQIGFTTSNPLDARSTVYCTEVARMVQAPIFHVNGDEPESIVLISQIALDYRMKFNKDVVIDMVCYRRHGHSEADEPSATQPMMYKKIKSHSLVKNLYSEKLLKEGHIDSSTLETLTKEYRTNLADGRCVAKDIMFDNFEKPFWVNWEPYLKANPNEKIDTTLDLPSIKKLMTTLCNVPKNLALHPQVERIHQSRLKMQRGEKSLDWGFAEILAYASLLESGHSVRLSGQDSGRGTFFHRHAIIHDQNDGSYYTPLKNVSPDQAKFNVFDSILSEEAVLAFEFGYSTAAPYSLVIWEAQFGDFANGAQVVIDQFICSSKSKWARLSGLVMLLPHGYDGQGPEHSSARLERYLQLCAENNLQVCMPSVPAQIFHLLRRQVLRKSRVPLIVMSPKSLLRHRLSVSSLTDITKSGFKNIIEEIDDLNAMNIDKVLLCAGKVYFDILDARRERDIKNIAIIRTEQLYPFPGDEVLKAIKLYPHVKKIVWVQEEPVNQGAWHFIYFNLLALLPSKYSFSVVARPEAASPAVGYFQKHLEQLHTLIDDALS